MSIRLLIADDYASMRCALRHFLEGNTDMQIVGEAANGQEAVQQCLRLKPDAVTMDVRMPLVDGVQATSKISRLMPHMAVLAVSSEADLWSVHKMFAAGASGYILKDFLLEDLEPAIRTVAAGHTFLGQLIIDKVLAHAIHGRSPLAHDQTAVLRGLAQGRSPEQTALDLHFPVDMVRQTLRSIARSASIPAIECLINHIQIQ